MYEVYLDQSVQIPLILIQCWDMWCMIYVCGMFDENWMLISHFIRVLLFYLFVVNVLAGVNRYIPYSYRIRNISVLEEI